MYHDDIPERPVGATSVAGRLPKDGRHRGPVPEHAGSAAPVLDRGPDVRMSRCRPTGADGQPGQRGGRGRHAQPGVEADRGTKAALNRGRGPGDRPPRRCLWPGLRAGQVPPATVLRVRQRRRSDEGTRTMNETTSRARLAHGSAGVLTWAALAGLLTVAPAGPANASARHVSQPAAATSGCHAQTACPDARLRLRLRLR